MLSHWQAEALLRVLSEKVPGQTTLENWTLLEVFTPHAQLSFTFTFTRTMELLQCAKLFDYAALYDLGKEKYDATLATCNRSLEIRETLLPHDHPCRKVRVVA
jgi:hypothetical protein